MSSDATDNTMRAELLPCPFCGDESPRMFYRMDESVYSHAAVQYLRITCDDCDCESIDSEDHNEVIAAWNRRADTARQVAEAVAAELAILLRRVPDEWVMVPRVPTQTMCIAGQDKAKEWRSFPLRISPIYQAMLAAAPPTDASQYSKPDRAPSEDGFTYG